MPDRDFIPPEGRAGFGLPELDTLFDGLEENDYQGMVDAALLAAKRMKANA